MANTLNYKGDCTASLLETKMPMGPDLLGAFWVPVSASYDGEQTTATMRSGTYEKCLAILRGEDEDAPVAH